VREADIDVVEVLDVLIDLVFVPVTPVLFVITLMDVPDTLAVDDFDLLDE